MLANLFHRSGKLKLAALLLGVMILPAWADEASILKTRESLNEWVETRRQISKERKDWALSKEVLADRINLISDEIESMKDRIAKTREEAAKTKDDRQKLDEENERYIAASKLLKARVIELESRVKAILPMLPDAARERVEPLILALPKDPEDSKVELTKRYGYVIGVLDQLNKFNTEIKVTSETRELPDGRSALVETVYFGLGQAYYVGGDGSVAGIGTVENGKWVWKPANESAPQIGRMLRILKNDEPAAYVPLPVKIDQKAGQ